MALTQQGLLARIEAEAAEKRSAVMKSMDLVERCNALAAKLNEAGLDISPVACIHRDHLSVWVQCHDMPEVEILAALKKCGMTVLGTQPGVDSKRHVDYVIEGNDVPLVASYIRFEVEA